MKKYLNIYYPLLHSFCQLRKDLLQEINSTINYLIKAAYGLKYIGICRSKKSLIVLFFLLIGFRAGAPETNALIIPESYGIMPFSDLMNAIATVETMGNHFAYNEIENAVGIFQIRQIRVDDYNRLTGSNYVLDDMFDPLISQKVFLYFASQVGPYHLEKIAKRWNGSGPKTELYWKRIMKHL